MVKLTEVEDEYFKDKGKTTKNDALLASDDEDDDYTDTGRCRFGHYLGFPSLARFHREKKKKLLRTLPYGRSADLFGFDINSCALSLLCSY